MGQHRPLFEAFVSLADSDDFKRLSQAQQQEIKNTLRDFKLSGVALPEEKRKRFAQIQSRLSELASSFSNQLMDATHNWTKLIPPSEEARLSGLPKNAKALAAQAAKEKVKKGGYLP